MLLESHALADLRDKFAPLVAECSGAMARLVWARNQHMVSKYIIACHADDRQTMFNPPSLVGCQGMSEFPSFLPGQYASIHPDGIQT